MNCSLCTTPSYPNTRCPISWIFAPFPSRWLFQREALPIPLSSRSRPSLRRKNPKRARERRLPGIRCRWLSQKFSYPHPRSMMTRIDLALSRRSPNCSKIQNLVDLHRRSRIVSVYWRYSRYWESWSATSPSWHWSWYWELLNMLFRKGLFCLLLGTTCKKIARSHF